MGKMIGDGGANPNIVAFGLDSGDCARLENSVGLVEADKGLVPYSPSLTVCSHEELVTIVG